MKFKKHCYVFILLYQNSYMYCKHALFSLIVYEVLKTVLNIRHTYNIIHNNPDQAG